MGEAGGWPRLLTFRLVASIVESLFEAGAVGELRSRVDGTGKSKDIYDLSD